MLLLPLTQDIWTIFDNLSSTDFRSLKDQRIRELEVENQKQAEEVISSLKQVFFSCPSNSKPTFVIVLTHCNALAVQFHDWKPSRPNPNLEHLQRAIFETFDLWDFWPLRHLIRAMRKHDLTNKKTTTKTKTNTMTMTNRFREQPQWGIFLDILRTPSDGHPREVLSLNSVRPFQTKFQNFGQISQSCSQISQPWNTWNTWS